MLINQSEYYRIMSQVTEKVNPENLQLNHCYRGLITGGSYDLFINVRLIDDINIVVSYLIISFDGQQDISEGTSFQKNGFKFFKLTEEQLELFHNVLIDGKLTVVNDVAM